MSEILILYYSRSGSVAQLARLSRQLSALCRERQRPVVLGFFPPMEPEVSVKATVVPAWVMSKVARPASTQRAREVVTEPPV